METIPYAILSTKFHSLLLSKRAQRIRSSNSVILRQPSLSSSISISINSPKILTLRHQRLRFVVGSSSNNHHDHHHHDHHHHQHDHIDDHHHHHNHHHSHSSDYANLTGAQRAIIGFAEATRWTELADFLREHLQLCCCSAALFVAAAICPYVLPKPVIKPFQNALIFIAFPLVGVCIDFCYSNILISPCLMGNIIL